MPERGDKGQLEFEFGDPAIVSSMGAVFDAGIAPRHVSRRNFEERLKLTKKRGPANVSLAVELPISDVIQQNRAVGEFGGFAVACSENNSRVLGKGGPKAVVVMTDPLAYLAQIRTSGEAYVTLVERVDGEKMGVLDRVEAAYHRGLRPGGEVKFAGDVAKLADEVEVRAGEDGVSEIEMARDLNTTPRKLVAYRDFANGAKEPLKECVDAGTLSMEVAGVVARLDEVGQEEVLRGTKSERKIYEHARERLGTKKKSGSGGGGGGGSGSDDGKDESLPRELVTASSDVGYHLAIANRHLPMVVGYLNVGSSAAALSRNEAYKNGVRGLEESLGILFHLRVGKHMGDVLRRLEKADLGMVAFHDLEAEVRKNQGNGKTRSPMQQRIPLEKLMIVGADANPVLVESVKRTGGVIEPILVEEVGGFYRVVEGYGSGRILATREAGYDDVPAIVVNKLDADELGMLKKAHTTMADLPTQAFLARRYYDALRMEEGGISPEAFARRAKANLPGVTEAEIVYASRLTGGVDTLVTRNVLPLDMVDVFSEFSGIKQDDLAAAGILEYVGREWGEGDMRRSLRSIYTDLRDQARQNLFKASMLQGLHTKFGKAVEYRFGLLVQSVDALTSALGRADNDDQRIKALKPVTASLYSLKQGVSSMRTGFE